MIAPVLVGVPMPDQKTTGLAGQPIKRVITRFQLERDLTALGLGRSIPNVGLAVGAVRRRTYRGKTYMETVKNWIGALTEIGLMLLALAIVATLLVGSNLPFFGDVPNNIMTLVKSLGDGGLVGLIALAIIIWLFSGRKIAGASSESDVSNV
jgi:ABC-type anion transport system duplicated permease subunit